MLFFPWSHSWKYQGQETDWVLFIFFNHSWKLRLTFFKFWGVLSNESTRSSKGNIIIILNINNKNRIPDSINFLTRTKQNDIIIALKETKKIPTLIRRTSGQRCNCVRPNWSLWWALPCKKGDSTRAISREWVITDESLLLLFFFKKI